MIFRKEVYDQVKKANKKNGVLYIEDITDEEFEKLKIIHCMYLDITKNLKESLRLYEEEFEYFSRRNKLSDLSQTMFRLIIPIITKPYNKAEMNGESYYIEDLKYSFEALPKEDVDKAVKELEESLAIVTMHEKGKTAIYVNPYLVNHGIVSDMVLDMFSGYKPLTLLDINLMNRLGEATAFMRKQIDKMDIDNKEEFLNDCLLSIKSYGVWANKNTGYISDIYLDPISLKQAQDIMNLPDDRFEKALEFLSELHLIHIAYDRSRKERVYVNPIIVQDNYIKRLKYDPFFTSMLRAKDIKMV